MFDRDENGELLMTFNGVMEVLTSKFKKKKQIKNKYIVYCIV